MKKNKLLMITTIACLLPILLSLIMYKSLPSEVAVHWDAQGNPNNYAPKAVAAFGIPVFMALLNIFTHFVINNDPKRANASFALKLIGKWVIPIITLIMVPVSLFTAKGYKIPVHIVATLIVGIIFIVIGNYLPKCKQNYTVGIKIPWTLNSEENWNRTHHMAGYLWMAGGVFVIITSFFGKTAMTITVGVILVISLIPIAYSYFLYKKGV